MAAKTAAKTVSIFSSVVFASCTIQSFAVDFHVKECHQKSQETPALLRPNKYLMDLFLHVLVVNKTRK